MKEAGAQGPGFLNEVIQSQGATMALEVGEVP